MLISVLSISMQNSQRNELEIESLFEEVNYHPPDSAASRSIFSWSEDQCLKKCAAIIPMCLMVSYSEMDKTCRMYKEKAKDRMDNRLQELIVEDERTFKVKMSQGRKLTTPDDCENGCSGYKCSSADSIYQSNWGVD